MIRLAILAPALVLALALSAAPALANCERCGLDFCQTDPRVPAALSDKKKSLSASYPQRLVGLLDIGEQCVARIKRSPDGFTLLLVRLDTTKSTLPWTAEAEERAKAQLASGELRRFWIVHSQRAFSCCGEPNFADRRDYDAMDDVNASYAIKCEKGAGCTR
jgi:hypothetical protein